MVARVGRIRASVINAIRPLTDVVIGPMHVTPVRSRGHLTSLVRYLLAQTDHHGLSTHAALWEGSCFPDLVGARRITRSNLVLTTLLPRLRQRDLFRIVRVGPVAPLSDAQVRALGARRLVGAAAGAACAPPDLRGRDDPSLVARRVAVHLGSSSGIPVSELAWALDLTPRAVRRIASRPVDVAAAAATRIRLALEEAVSGAGGSR